MIDAHCGQLIRPRRSSQLDERYLPDGVRIVQAAADGQRATRDDPR